MLFNVLRANGVGCILLSLSLIQPIWNRQSHSCETLNKPLLIYRFPERVNYCTYAKAFVLAPLIIKAKTEKARKIQTEINNRLSRPRHFQSSKASVLVVMFKCQHIHSLQYLELRGTSSPSTHHYNFCC